MASRGLLPTRLKTMTTIKAPFTPAQVQTLNERQCRVDGGLPMHPMTCPNRNDGVFFDEARCEFDTSGATHSTVGGDRGVLIATQAGWVCPHCGYTQDWAHSLMAMKPLPMAESVRLFPALRAIYQNLRPEILAPLITEYRKMARQGLPGADVMWFCLEHRRVALASSETAEEVTG